MRQIRSEAIVLRTYDLRESDKIVVLFTSDYGKLSAVAKAAKKSMKRFGGCLEPLTRVRALLSDVKGSELMRVDQLELIESFFDLLKEPRRLAGFSYIAELCDCFSQPAAPCAPLFRLVNHCLKNGRRVPIDLVLRYFEVWLLKLEGLLPSMERCGECGKALAGRRIRVAVTGELAGCASCITGSAGGCVHVSAQGRSVIASMLERPLDSMVNYEVFHRHASEIEGMLKALVDAHAGRALKSRRFL